MKYLVILERGENNSSAYSPDLPGCIAVSDTPEETMSLMRDAVRTHLESLQLDGEPIPEPRTSADYAAVP